MKRSPSFSKVLLSWYRTNRRDLPWRRTRDPYKIWVSEIMLQQTTVKAVIPYYERWIKVFPDVQSLSKAPLQKVLKQWQGLGYYSRARNIHKASQIICRKLNGKIPQTAEDLKNIPGFGPYTIGAVLSIAFNKRHPIIDANVRRLIMRLLAIEGVADTSQDERIYEFLDEVMPQKDMSDFNQGLMELGALVCRKSEVLCSVCPFKVNCQAFKKGMQEIIPAAVKKNIQDVDVVIAIIKVGGKYLIQQRPAKGLFADLWEFPGGKVEIGESPIQALKREVKEEVGGSLKSEKFLFNVNQYYTQFRAKLHVYECEAKASPNLKGNQKWVNFEELKKHPVPSGSARIIDRLQLDQKNT